MQLEIEPQKWKTEFFESFGHYPKILCVGNVANNAYQIAKLLNMEGIECDVLCNDYYHVMGCPEWEDAGIIGGVENPLYPDFEPLDTHGFNRPKWFAQGPLMDAMDYLMAKRKAALGFLSWRKYVGLYEEGIEWNRLEEIRKYIVHHNGKLPPQSAMRNNKIAEKRYRQHRRKQFIEDWAACFPNRTPIEWSSISDMFLNAGVTIQPLFDQYDIIAAFGSSVMLAYYAGCKKYIAFEHGTIRGIQDSETEMDKLLMLSYAKSNVVVNTNIDCYDAAEYIVANSDSIHFCGLHGIGMNELIEKSNRESETAFRNKIGVDKGEFVIFFPARHDYDAAQKKYIKGDGKVHEGLRLLAEAGYEFTVVMEKWGNDVERFVDEIDADKILKRHIKWIDSLPKNEFVQAVRGSDVLLDQFNYAVFGGIALEGMAAKKAVVVSHPIDKKIMGKFFSSPWPILEANSAEEIKNKIESVIENKNNAMEIVDRQFRWVCKEHGSDRIVNLFCGALDLAVRDRNP